MTRTITLTLIALGLSIAPALADTARTSARLPVFDRPSDSGDLLGHVEADVELEVIDCTRPTGWCLVGNPGAKKGVGWVRAGYLIGVGAIQKASPFEFLVNPDLAGIGVKVGP